ncbi:MAG TPA: hypothetical protein VGJ39_07555 [Vicinamibacterales bacterium]
MILASDELPPSYRRAIEIRAAPDPLEQVALMPETRARLGEQLTRRLTRWRSAAVPILQAAIAAGFSWLIAVHIVDHRAPFFAPVAAIVSVGLTLGQRLRRAIESSVLRSVSGSAIR